jgi:glutamate racemase
VQLVCVAATGLALAIEQRDSAKITELLKAYLSTFAPWGNATGETDTLVLGCTHYPFETTQIQKIVGDTVSIVDNGAAVARHARRVLAQFDQLNPSTHQGAIDLQASDHLDQLAHFFQNQVSLNRPAALPNVQMARPV